MAGLAGLFEDEAQHGFQVGCGHRAEPCVAVGGALARERQEGANALLFRILVFQVGGIGTVEAKGLAAFRCVVGVPMRVQAA